jgi:predicted Zn finger-like uncharacterized protein
VKLNCPECGAEIPADNINLDRMVAKCRECNTVFGFGDQFGASAGAQSLVRLAVPRPASLQVEQDGAELRLTRRWFSPTYIFLGIFAIFWNGFMAVWFGIAIISRMWPMALFGSIHAAIGLFIAYVAVAGLVNSTLVRIGMGEIQVSHSPLPWRGNRRIETAGIAQLYSKEISHRSRRRTTQSYEIHAATGDGRDIKLLSALENSEQALYLEQEIERYLGIKDLPMRGEIPR